MAKKKLTVKEDSLEIKANLPPVDKPIDVAPVPHGEELLSVAENAPHVSGDEERLEHRAGTYVMTREEIKGLKEDQTLVHRIQIGHRYRVGKAAARKEISAAKAALKNAPEGEKGAAEKRLQEAREEYARITDTADVLRAKEARAEKKAALVAAKAELRGLKGSEDQGKIDHATVALDKAELEFGLAETAMRVETMFPLVQRDAIRDLFADVFSAIISQQLVKTSNGRRCAAEVLLANPAARSLIRQGKYVQLQNVMMSGRAQGMQTMELALKAIGYEEAT